MKTSMEGESMKDSKKKYTKGILFKPDPFSKCPEEIQLAAYQLVREKIEEWRKRRK